MIVRRRDRRRPRPRPAPPVVARIEGTNAPQGRKLLQESGLDLIAATDLTDAARKVVAAVARK